MKCISMRRAWNSNKSSYNPWNTYVPRLSNGLMPDESGNGSIWKGFSYGLQKKLLVPPEILTPLEPAIFFFGKNCWTQIR